MVLVCSLRRLEEREVNARLRRSVTRELSRDDWKSINFTSLGSPASSYLETFVTIHILSTGSTLRT